MGKGGMEEDWVGVREHEDELKKESSKKIGRMEG